MGTLQCQHCFVTAVAETKEEAISLIDHGAQSKKKCSGKDEYCTWSESHREIQGVNSVAPKITTKPAPKKSRK